jgi:predicted chitinase
VKLLLESARDDRTRIRVAITMRSDFLGHCVRFLELPDAINRGQYLTPRLDRSQLTSAILEPARVFGGAVDASLATELVNAMGADQDQLPILQDALAQMWDLAVRRDAATPRVTLTDLNAIDGITGALGRRADSLFEDLSPSDRRVAEVLFRAITERSIGNGSARDLRRPQTLRDVARISGLDWQVFVPVVESFAADGVNFLVCSTPIGADTLVDISHEALIRQWGRLRRWVDDEDRQARELALWRQRSMGHATGGELLAGNDLMRAVEWRDALNATIRLSVPSNDGREVLVRSAAAWASRYAVAAGPGSSFEEIVAFIAGSEEKQQAEIDARNTAERLSVKLKQQRLEAEKAAAEAKAETERARAEAARREKELAEHLVGRLETQRKIAWTIAVIAFAASIFAFISFRRATEATEETVKAVDRAIKAIRDAHVAARQAADERVEKVLIKADLQRAQAQLEFEKGQQAAKEHVYQASHELPATVVTTTAAVTTTAVTSTTAATTTAASTTSVTPLPTSTVGSSGHLLDDGALAALAPGLSVEQRTAILSAILPAMREFEINTPLRQAAFVAQMAHESGGFRFTEESFNYSADRLKAVWPTQFSDSDRAKNYAHQPQKIANYVYAGKFGNGPEASGDGWRYRGRGPMLITGRGSYQRFGAVVGVDLEKEPDRAAEWSVGFRIAGVLWTTKKANGFADQGDLQSITRALNGGLIGQAERIAWYVRSKKALGIE